MELARKTAKTGQPTLPAAKKMMDESEGDEPYQRRQFYEEPERRHLQCTQAPVTCLEERAPAGPERRRDPGLPLAEFFYALPQAAREVTAHDHLGDVGEAVEGGPARA